MGFFITFIKAGQGSHLSYNSCILEKKFVYCPIFLVSVLYFLCFVFFPHISHKKMFFVIDTRCDYRDDGTSYINYKRIDEFWRCVLESTNSLGSPKYPSLGVLVNAALNLLHGQADVE